jgi:predicted amidohydrolase
MTSNDTFRVSLVQMQVTGNQERNGDRGAELVRDAGKADPDLIALPENFNFTGTEEEKLEHAETWDGPTLPKIQEAARDVGCHVLAGTIKMKEEGEDLLRNVSALLGPDGEVQTTYEKVHVFNANVGNTDVENDRVERGGRETVVAEVNGVSVGLTVCFDVRFPELYRILALKGAEVIMVPSMFTLHTGKDHWDTLLRARAIENQVFVAAPAVYGKKPTGAYTYGRSLVADPWGTITDKQPDNEGVLTANLDLSTVDDVRESLPTLPQRVPEVYDWPN